MSDFEDLDDVFGALRSPAMPSELSGETGMVDLMASNHRAAKGSTMFTSRRTRVAVLIAAGVIGFGGVAAAGPGGLGRSNKGAVVTTTTAVTTTTEALDDTTTTEMVEVTTTTGVPEDESVQRTETAVVETEGATTTTLADDLSTAFDERTCLEGNHGKTVSAVARGEAPFEGVEVRDSAQSSCGKDDDENEAIEDDANEVEVDNDSLDAPDHGDDHGQENAGKGKGNGGENKPAESRGGGKGKSGEDDD